MKRLTAFVLVSAGLALVLAGSTPVQADAPGTVTGSAQFVMEYYAPYPTIVWADAWAEFNAVADGPWEGGSEEAQRAKGWIRLRLYHETTGWASARTNLSCVQFGEDERGQYALLVSEVVDQSGLDPSVLGTYWVHKVYDNGTPGSQGDLLGYYAGDAFPGWSYDPVCAVPGAYLAGWHLEYPVEGGNLMVRP
jgi:hypothetical protein